MGKSFLLLVPSKVLSISHRRANNTVELVQDHMFGVLAVVFELLQYGAPLQTSHWSAMGLIAGSSDRYDLEHNRRLVLDRLRTEWNMVLRMEDGVATSSLLKKHCPYVCYQVYREIMSMSERNRFELSTDLRDFLSCWFPAVTASAVVEDCFSSIQDAVARSSKADVGSLPNMAAVAIRSVERKAAAVPELHGINLEGEDWEGNSVRALKQQVFQPDSCPASISPTRIRMKWT